MLVLNFPKVFLPLPPSLVGIKVGEGDDLAAEEDFHAVVELAESAGGEPEELRKDCGADSRSLFVFNQSDGEVRAGQRGSRCSPNRHWDSVQSAGS